MGVSQDDTRLWRWHRTECVVGVNDMVYNAAWTEQQIHAAILRRHALDPIPNSKVKSLQAGLVVR